jgi:hypothetical protein
MQENVDNRIAHIADYSRAELVSEFERLWGKPPPASLSLNLLRWAAAYQWQVKAHSAETQVREIGKMIQSLTRNTVPNTTESKASKTSVWSTTMQIKPGTKLRRVWKGKIIEVTALGRGFLIDDKTYGSLSEAARDVTGTRWNGHVFFGLKQTKGATHDRAAA